MANGHPETPLVVVEFVGPAGVGKTFLSAKVFDVLQRRNTPVADFRTISINKFSFRTVATVLRATFLAASIKPKSLDAYIHATREIAKLRIRWDVCRQRRGIYLCDEGVIHRLRTFSRASNRLNMTEIAERLVRLVTVGRIVVVAKASVEKILARRTDRQKPGDEFTRESVAADVQLLQESISTVEHLQRTLNYDIRIILVDVEDDSCVGFAEHIADAAQTALLEAAATR